MLNWLTVPQTPSGFNITEEAYTTTNVTVSFQWDEPLGSAAEAIVDYYYITVSPRPLYPFENNMLPNSSLDFTVILDYNITYTISVTAENCAGESEAFVKSIVYGMWLQ